MLGWLLQQRAARHLTMGLLKASEELLRATAADPSLQCKVSFKFPLGAAIWYAAVHNFSKITVKPV